MESNHSNQAGSKLQNSQLLHRPLSLTFNVAKVEIVLNEREEENFVLWLFL